MTRSQVWFTVSWESVITSLLGAVLGVARLVTGFLLVISLKDQGITVFRIPVISTIVILVVSFIVGVIPRCFRRVGPPRSTSSERSPRHDLAHVRMGT